MTISDKRQQEGVEGRYHMPGSDRRSRTESPGPSLRSRSEPLGAKGWSLSKPRNRITADLPNIIYNIHITF